MFFAADQCADAFLSLQTFFMQSMSGICFIIVQGMSGNLGVRRGSRVVVGRIVVPPPGCPGTRFDKWCKGLLVGIFPDMPCMKKKFTMTNRCRTIGQQPGTKSGHFPADQLVINRLLCSPLGLNGISFVRASENSFGTIVFDALEIIGGHGGRLSPGRTDPSASRPAWPRSAPPPWYLRFLGSINICCPVHI